MNDVNSLRVLFLSAEADPFIKVGGLGDVAGSLPTALRALPTLSRTNGSLSANIDIRLVIPYHGAIDKSKHNIKPLTSVNVPHTSGDITAQIYETTFNQVPVYLIAGEPIPPSVPVYSSDWGFDAHKYIFFSLAALEMVRKLDWSPHVVHANDWHTAPAIYWLSLHRDEDEFFRNTATLLCIHNLPYMGVGAAFPMESFFLPPAQPDDLPEWARHLPLPLGLLTADRIVAVSPTYAEEILTRDFGAGLEGFLQGRKSEISGILNGLDLTNWDPQRDDYISQRYSVRSLHLREANKTHLINTLRIPTPSAENNDKRTPLLAMVSRMDYQKGLDLAVEALYYLASGAETDHIPWQAIFLGTGMVELEAFARRLEAQFPERVRVAVRFDAPLSHQVYAGADMLLMPSRYEPCGLSQMIALRYGCVPIARATGGLKDSILNYDDRKNGTGFLFDETTPQALLKSIQRALSVYADRDAWQALQRRGMKQDFSWERSALEYRRLYDTLVLERTAQLNH